MQLRENLSDHQAAESVRSRISWKYLLGLKLIDVGFDFSVLSEFRKRLIENKQENLLLDKSQVKVVIALAEAGELTIREICEQVGCSRSTYYRQVAPQLKAQ